MHQIDTVLRRCSYDVRGIYNTDIDEAGLYNLARAFATHYASVQTIAVGYDARLSSKSLVAEVIRGLTESGKTVVDLGLVSTDMCGYATMAYDDIDASVMVTASHNPKEYNGIKATLKNAIPVNFKAIGESLIAIMQEGKYTQGNGRVLTRDICDDFVEAIAKVAGEADYAKYTVVADAGNGVAGVFMEKLAKKLGFRLIGMYLEPDGNFPNHHPSPIEPENTRDLSERVVREGADLGVAFDGDGDRAYLCDERGEILSGSITTALIARRILRTHPGGTILRNTVSSRIVQDVVTECGGKNALEKVGHVYIKENLNKNPDIVFAGEHSGHYYFRDFKGMDSGVTAFAVAMAELLAIDKPISAVHAELNRYYAIPETNSRVQSVSEVLEAIQKRYADGEVTVYDGVSVTYNDVWFNVRPSSNEPLLRLNLEARTPELRDTKAREILDFIRTNF